MQTGVQQADRDPRMIIGRETAPAISSRGRWCSVEISESVHRQDCADPPTSSAFAAGPATPNAHCRPRGLCFLMPATKAEASAGRTLSRRLGVEHGQDQSALSAPPDAGPQRARCGLGRLQRRPQLRRRPTRRRRSLRCEVDDQPARGILAACRGPWFGGPAASWSSESLGAASAGQPPACEFDLLRRVNFSRTCPAQPRRKHDRRL